MTPNTLIFRAQFTARDGRELLSRPFQTIEAAAIYAARVVPARPGELLTARDGAAATASDVDRSRRFSIIPARAYDPELEESGLLEPALAG